jgi:hypothetical protein
MIRGAYPTIAAAGMNLFFEDDRGYPAPHYVYVCRDYFAKLYYEPDQVLPAEDKAFLRIYDDGTYAAENALLPNSMYVLAVRCVGR